MASLVKGVLLEFRAEISSETGVLSIQALGYHTYCIIIAMAIITAVISLLMSSYMNSIGIRVYFSTLHRSSTFEL